MTERPYRWDQLRRLSLARQLHRIRGRGVDAVIETVRRTGPLQTQTARSTFLGIAARLPGVTHATISEALQTHALVRGSTIRGTVHTSTPEQHVWLDRATRVGQRAIWARTLDLRRTSLEQVWSGIEEFATPSWREVEELRTHLTDWLVRHEGAESEAMATTLGRSLCFGHGGLVRRPLSGGWEGQGRPGYRAVAAVLEEIGHPDVGALAHARASSHEEAMAAVVRLHLRSHGPASRRDVAWWSGLGLREVDAALVRLGPEVAARPGPDGQDHWDLADGGPRPVTDDVTRLLPEFDALLCGYHPGGRDRFVTPEQHTVLWNQQNGLLRAPLLHRGRIAGWWRAEGSGRARRFTVVPFPDAPVPSLDDLGRAVQDAATAMAWTVQDVTLGP